LGFNKKTINDIDVAGKRVLVRVDFNVPLKNGKITDDYRIKKALPTINALIEKGAKIILCSHIGRPDGVPVQKYSLKPCGVRLGELLDKKINFVSDCIGRDAKKKSDLLREGEILLLENLRFYSEEVANDDDFAKNLAELADVFVQDGFGVAHRAHASTDAITKHLPSVAGLLVEREVDTITKVLENPERPLMAVIGGAKISDKIQILKRFIKIADFVVVGGAMANTFLLAQGMKIGKSLADKKDVPLAREIMELAHKESKKRQFIFYLPQDGVVATDKENPQFTRVVDWGVHAFASIQSYPARPPLKTEKVLSNERILDIGPFSGAFISGGIQLAKTVVWNGALGVTETGAVHGPIGPFSHGTDLLVNALMGDHGNKPRSVVGGGDTVGYVEGRKLSDYFMHVSTGGGASMELMSGNKLPGVEALANKSKKS
jgi:phosphoglycerate kinase